MFVIKWFIQQSGRGYKIKNCKYGVYLSAPNGQMGTVVGASETPMVWTMLRTHAGFLIQYGEEDSVIDMRFGTTNQEDVMVLWKSDGCPDARRWSFEHMSNDTGGEKVDPIEDESEIGRLKRELAKQRAQLVLKDHEIAEKDQQLAEQASLLSRRETLNKDNTLAEIRKEIKELHEVVQVRG
ncbi:hypothetical protein FRC07_001364 [Ceratobasidium sp. 392]|nr:hypothetical protein FRC07_001364 [Ceratobasidium sp. 392]